MFYSSLSFSQCLTPLLLLVSSIPLGTFLPFHTFLVLFRFPLQLTRFELVIVTWKATVIPFHQSCFFFTSPPILFLFSLSPFSSAFPSLFPLFCYVISPFLLSLVFPYSSLLLPFVLPLCLSAPLGAYPRHSKTRTHIHDFGNRYSSL